MDEFALIERILAELGAAGTVKASADAPSWLIAGPGDDAAIIRPPPDAEMASSIDSFLADVHFPAAAAPDLIGYRCMTAALSDLAAMAAEPAWALVALDLPAGDADWVARLAGGLAEAAHGAGARIIGGNLAAGPLSITISVQGWAPAGALLLRSGAQPGDALCLSAPLGGAARALAELDLSKSRPGQLSPLEQSYWRPQPPFTLAADLRAGATAGLDISDGLLQDLGHLAKASGVRIEVRTEAIPLAPGARLHDALSGGDDYALAFTTSQEKLTSRFPVIGRISAGQGLHLDGKPTTASGFRHFR